MTILFIVTETPVVEKICTHCNAHPHAVNHCLLLGDAFQHESSITQPAVELCLEDKQIDQHNPQHLNLAGCLVVQREHVG